MKLFGFLSFPVEAFGEAFYATGRIENFVVAREEGVASVADIRANFSCCCAGFEFIAASTGD
jgi:hypothetical protein